MTDETEIKQNYLREKILDCGYDANEFMNYLIGLNGENATDIDNYSLNDLKQVYKFIKNYSMLMILLN